MMSVIGKNKQSGLTFIEMMLAIGIFTLGIAGFIRTYQMSLDRISSFTQRIYANHLIDNRMAEIEKVLRYQKALPFGEASQGELVVGERVFPYEQRLKISSVGNHFGLFAVDLTLAFPGDKEPLVVSRDSFIAEFAQNQ